MIFTFDTFSISLESYYLISYQTLPMSSILALAFLLFSVFLVFRFLSKKLSNSIYIVDFACLKPPGSLRVPYNAYMEHLVVAKLLDDESIDFLSKVIQKSGLGEETCLPPGLRYLPPRPNQAECIQEVEIVFFPVMDELIAKTGVSPEDIDVLVVNCSGFCPSPSLSSIIINKYKMRADIKSYNLSGMGCSASIIGVDVAKNFLSLYPNSNAIVLSTEILTIGWYNGKDRRKHIINCVFRMGCAGILLSNKKEARKKAKYEVMCMVRTHMAHEDRAYLSTIREEDSEGITGVTIEKDIMYVAAELLKQNIAILCRHILPLKEKILYLIFILKSKLNLISPKEVYVPNMKLAIQHFCIPVSSKRLIREIGRRLGLRPSDVEPALMTLHRFGNQSSSSLWYELAYLEAKRKVKKGEKVWLLGMGSGPKCNSLICKSLKSTSGGDEEFGPWCGIIDKFPVEI